MYHKVKKILDLQLKEAHTLIEKMGDMEDSEEGIVHEISNYPNVRRHHRRGKRKPRVRRRTLSAELTPAEDSAQNSSKEMEAMNKELTKHPVLNSNVDKEKSFQSKGLNEFNIKSKETIQNDRLNEWNKKHRQKRQHRHPRHRQYSKMYTNGVSKVFSSGEKKSNKFLILRPNRCPDAPKNSTQFIIDDHEDEPEDNAGYVNIIKYKWLLRKLNSVSPHPLF